MEQAVVVGNCQASALEHVLSTSDAFNERFELVRFPPVHEFPAELIPRLHESVAEAAVVIAQRVDDGYRDGIGLGTDTLASIARGTFVRWPSVYWAGYFPDLFYLRNEDRSPVLDGPFDYHDRTILGAYAEGLDVAAALARLADPEVPSSAVEWARTATAELALRGEDCDVDVAPFIESRFREELLFYTMNHPTNVMLAFIGERVLELLELPGGVVTASMPGEVLSSTFYPLHANHVRALGLRFGAELGAGRTPFRIRGVVHSPHEAVQAFYDYYETHERLVELNRD